MSEHARPVPAAEPVRHPVTPSDSCWDAFVNTHQHGHLLQTSAWAELKERSGWSAFRVALADAEGGIAAGASVLMRSVVGLRLAYLPRGPLTDWRDAGLTLEVLQAVESACRERGASVLKIEPGLPDSPANRLLLERYGFFPSPQTVQPRSTIVVDIAYDEDAILQRMKSKWRYNIRLAARKDVTVRAGRRQDLAAFNKLMTATGERDGFGVHSAQYYRDAYDLLVPDRAVYLLAEYEGEPLAAIVVGVTGDTAYYLWGASSDKERNRMPNHALQWAGIQWAKAYGATRYDLWGIPDDLGKVALGLSTDTGPASADTLPVELSVMPAHDLWGVFRFKQGFGGYVERDVGAWDNSLHPIGHRLYATGLALRAHRQVLPAYIRRLGVGQSTDHVTDQAQTTVAEAAGWRAALSALPHPHVLQSWEWGDIKAQTGWQADRVILHTDAEGEPVAAFQFLTRALAPNAPVRIGYVPKGPVVDWGDGAAVNTALDAIQDHARRRNCVFVKIDPDVRSDLAEGVVLKEKFKRRGWRFSREQIQFQNTAYSDLRPDEDELLAAMKSKWRYNIRLARRRGITVREAGTDDLQAFYAMYAETGERDGFLIRPYAYYASTWGTLLAAQEDDANPAGGALLLAEHLDESVPVAGLFLMRYADRAWYFYGASTERRRRDMPNYLLQWEAMTWARSHGCTVYDWWGAPTDVSDPLDPMQGVWQFKQGFGAEFQPHVGAWDYVVNPALYALYAGAMPKALDLMKRWNQRGNQ